MSNMKQAKIGDIVQVKMSKGAYTLRLGTKEQVDIFNRDLADKQNWTIVRRSAQ